MKIAMLSLALAGALNAAYAADAPASDPYGWLEDVTSAKSLDWVKAHNAFTTGLLEKDPGFDQLHKQVLEVAASKDHIPYIGKMGKWVYNFWTDVDHPRGLWRRTSLDEYRKADPKWETVLDIDALGKSEKVNWVWKGANCRYPAWDRCLVNLSRGGADAVEVREFDLNTVAFVKNGFKLPENKTEVDWQGKDDIFVATDFGKGSMTDSGYARIVKLWHRGTPLAKAQTVYAGKQADVSVNAFTYQHTGYRYEVVSREVTTFSNEYYLRKHGKLAHIDVPNDATVGFFGPQLLVTLRSPWQVGGKQYAAGTLLATDFNAFLAGKRDFQPLFEPTPTTALSGTTPTAHYLILDTLDTVKSRLAEWAFHDGKWTRRDIDAPAFGKLDVEALDDESDDYLLNQVDFLSPSSYWLAHAGNDQRERLKSQPAYFDATRFDVAQYQVKSKDGTQVPYFVVKPKDLKLDGNNPTLLYAYGGFEISETPFYSGVVGRAWLNKGGVYVLANIRGGGEFGPTWHTSAIKDKRQNAYDDFISVAQDLTARKITQPKKLGIMGGSNGGLLMGVMLTERPDLFGAVVCQAPLLDMQRYTKLLAGASWMGEYGDPDDPAQWAYIQKYSPYQNVKEGVQYPNILFTTSTRDDRVHPGHARKMMAKLEGTGVKTAWFYENIEGGHAGAADPAQRAYMAALEYTFLWQKLQ